MHSDQKRCIYGKNQLADVICQLRFPEILTINSQAPADFQELIRSEFPRYSANKELVPSRAAPGSGNMNMNYQFISEDGVWRVNVTSTFISLACAKYTCWEAFAKKLDLPLAAFIKTYKPAFFERIGLRYINFISREELQLTDVPFSELFAPAYLGLLGEEDVPESSAVRSGVDAQIKIKGGCQVNIHAGPGIVKKNGQTDKEVKFILDQDLFLSGNTPVNYSAGALEALHSQAYPIFRGAITDALHEALEPDSEN